MEGALSFMNGLLAFLSGIALAALGFGAAAGAMLVPPRPAFAEMVAFGFMGAILGAYGLFSAALVLTPQIDVGCLHLRRGKPLL